MIDMLKSIGIEKGTPFAPDDALQDVLSEAIDEAHAWLDAQYEQVLTAPFFNDANWALPASTELGTASLGFTGL